MDKYDEQIKCSFCERGQDEVNRLVAGKRGYICDECIAYCQEIIQSEEDMMAEEPDFSVENLPTPKELVELIDDYVIEQQDAKKALAVAIYNHYNKARTTGMPHCFAPFFIA